MPRGALLGNTFLRRKVVGPESRAAGLTERRGDMVFFFLASDKDGL